jgi:molybdopterin-guanine dinucleotide biosynthesis protein B
VLIKPLTGEPDLNEIARLLGEDYDIILAEGFKQSQTPKVEVHRKAAGPPLSRISNLIAIATDKPLEASTRQFPLNDIKALADFLESGFIKSK